MQESKERVLNAEILLEPPADGIRIELVRDRNIQPLPDLDPLPDRLEPRVLLAAGDDLSTEEILSAGAQALPLRSNIPEISRYLFSRLDPNADERAMTYRAEGSAIVAGTNCG